MDVIANYRVIFSDVDDTLITSHPIEGETGAPIYIVKDLYTLVRYPIIRHVTMLQEMKAKGNTIIVWSQSGYDWCEDIVKALALEPYVDYCMTKPVVYIDDLDARHWTRRLNLLEEGEGLK